MSYSDRLQEWLSDHPDEPGDYYDQLEAVGALMASVVPDNPLTWSHEGLDDGCFWCGARTKYRVIPGGQPWQQEAYADHGADCDWVIARRALGLSTHAGVRS